MAVEFLKSGVRALCRAAGLEVNRTKNANIESTTVRNLINATGARVILDVGANAGQFGEMVFRGGFKGTLVSFEAIPEVHARLVQRAKRQGDAWVVAPCVALGSKRGQIEFNIAGNSVSSSVLPMTQTHRDAAPGSKYLAKQLIQIATLDELAPELIPVTGPVLLKVDTQGYEMEVLKGAANILRRTVALQLELSLTSLYEGAPTLLEMISFMKNEGCELFSLVPGFRDRKTGRLLQVDGYFIRESATKTLDAGTT
jgi:FkbM family methyltransferase